VEAAEVEPTQRLNTRYDLDTAGLSNPPAALTPNLSWRREVSEFEAKDARLGECSGMTPERSGEKFGKIDVLRMGSEV
jgi:hypothetical protein